MSGKRAARFKTSDIVPRETLNKLLVEHEGDIDKIIVCLKRQGIILGKTQIWHLIYQNETSAKIFREQKEIRRKREYEERVAAFPDKEELEQLLETHYGNLTNARRFLEQQGRKISMSELLDLIDQYGLEDLRKQKTKKRAVQFGQKGFNSFSEATTSQEKDLPLSPEEIELVSVYEDGDSEQTLAIKTNQSGEARVSRLIASILAKKHAASLPAAKEKSKQELVET